MPDKLRIHCPLGSWLSRKALVDVSIQGGIRRGRKKVLQTGQTFKAIDSNTMVQFETMSLVELWSEWAPNFTINLYFLPEGRVVFSVRRALLWCGGSKEEQQRHCLDTFKMPEMNSRNLTTSASSLVISKNDPTALRVATLRNGVLH